MLLLVWATLFYVLRGAWEQRVTGSWCPLAVFLAGSRRKGVWEAVSFLKAVVKMLTKLPNIFVLCTAGKGGDTGVYRYRQEAWPHLHRAGAGLVQEQVRMGTGQGWEENGRNNCARRCQFRKW